MDEGVMCKGKAGRDKRKEIERRREGRWRWRRELHV